MHLLHHMRQPDLARWGHNILSRRCHSQDADCTKTRITLINTIGQVQSPEAQRVLVNTVMKKDPSDDDLEHAIYHLGSQEHPIMVWYCLVALYNYMASVF